MRQINRVGVLGAGVMGATIAAHLANAGLEVLLLDIVPKDLTEQEQAKGLTLENPQVRNRIAQAGKDGLIKMKPAPFYLKDYAAQISVGNLEDDLAKLKECDWVIEVVVEYMPIKLDLLTIYGSSVTIRRDLLRSISSMWTLAWMLTRPRPDP